MKKALTLLISVIGSLGLQAATGGPDQYGYIWKDSAEPDGPVYSWVDITATGMAVTGLADDNTFGPFIMSGNMPYYWYDVKKVWVGSNGYVAFNGGNIAANFPNLPAAGGTENYIAAFMADLTFGGTGNPAQCFLQDEPGRLIVSWINVPFWNVAAPGYTGSNTFQLILNKQDSTITIQFQSCTGTTTSNGPVIGIESITGSIGLARTQSLMPAPGYAVRFYNPANPLLQVTDAAVEWAGVPGTGATNITVGATLPLAVGLLNAGNQPLTSFTITSEVLSPGGQAVLTETVTVDSMQAGGNLEPVLAQAFTPAAPGTYRHRITISGVAGDLIATNNMMEREIGVYAPAVTGIPVSWAGASDDGLGLAWNGGDGGIGVYIIPPYYPCQITGTTIRITSNSGSNFNMKVYDDDGPGGGPGTLLDSVLVTAVNGGPGDHVYPLAGSNIQVTDGGYYVVWYMLGPNVNIAVDVLGPFSMQCHEVLGGAWAEYRARTTTDFHLGLRIEQPPFLDVGVAGLIGISNGQSISGPTTIQALVHNYGNTPANGFPVSYSYNNGAVVTQNYTGSNIAPGNSGVITFTQQLVPLDNSTGSLCVWTAAGTDVLNQNDTSCVGVNVQVGIVEQDGLRVRLFPDPAMDRLSVEGLPDGEARIWVLDTQGRTAWSTKLAVSGGRVQLDVSGIPNGNYVLRFASADRLLHGRFTVQH